MKKIFEVAIWGARGSIASCSPETKKYGGNTSCVEVKLGEEILVLDAGSGIRLLGDDLTKRGVKKVNLLFGHCHYDHICGLPFFRPVWNEDATINLWSGHLEGKNKTKRMCKEYMRAPFFPVGPDKAIAKIQYNDFDAGDQLNPIDGVIINTMALNHHNNCIGYRINFLGQRSMCYIVDNAHIQKKTDHKLVEFIKDSDLVIYDATYTDDEFEQFADFGHSTWQEGLRICSIANAKRYCMFHHRPSRTDKQLDKIKKDAKVMSKKMKGHKPVIIVAKEGDKIKL